MSIRLIISHFRESAFLAVANGLPRSEWIDRVVRSRLYKLAGLRILGHCLIWGPLTIRPIGGTRNIRIGEGTFINTEVRFGVPIDPVIIGKNVHVGPRVMFETVAHSLHFQPNIGRKTSTKPIIVEDEAWIGAGAIITQGVIIGRGAVVAAGSVVIKNVDANTLVGGIPAKLIRLIGTDE
jgi:maltose O-acetyltransferase